MEIEWARREDERLSEDERLRLRRLNAAAANKLVRILHRLALADDLDYLFRNPAFKFEPLRGNRSGQYSMRLTGHDRVIFEMSDRPNTVRILQVGGHYD